MKFDFKKAKKNGVDTAILLGSLLAARKGLEFAGDQAGGAISKYLPAGFAVIGIAAQFSKNDLVATVGKSVGVVGLEAAIRQGITNGDGSTKTDSISQFVAKAMPRSSGLGSIPMLPARTEFSVTAERPEPSNFLGTLNSASAWL